MSIIDLEKYKQKGKKYNLATYDSYYECTFIKGYQHKYSQDSIYGVEVGGVYAILLKVNKDKLDFAAIHFFKGDFTLPQALEWLENYGIELMEEGKTQQPIKNCDKILDILPYKNNHLILYKKGKETVNLAYQPIYSSSTKVTNTSDGEQTEQSTKIILILNGEKLDYIPRIKFNKQKDIVICNGNCIVADYIHGYNGNIGFFLDINPSLPISFIFAEKTTVYIDIIEREHNKICIVEYDYELKIDN